MPRGEWSFARLCCCQARCLDAKSVSNTPAALVTRNLLFRDGKEPLPVRPMARYLITRFAGHYIPGLTTC